AQRLAARSAAALGVDPVESLALADEGVRRRRSIETESALRAALAAARTLAILRIQRDGEVLQATFSPDGRRVVTRSDRSARLWTGDERGDAEVWQLPGGALVKRIRGAGLVEAFGRGGVAASADRLRVLDPMTGAVKRTLPRAIASAFTTGGRLVAAGTDGRL